MVTPDRIEPTGMGLSSGW